MKAAYGDVLIGAGWYVRFDGARWAVFGRGLGFVARGRAKTLAYAIALARIAVSSRL